MKMAKAVSAKKAGTLLGISHLEVIRRIRKGQIPAHKFAGGWTWVINLDDIEKVKEMEWYKLYQRRRRVS
jgi:hypothetical protein